MIGESYKPKKFEEKNQPEEIGSKIVLPYYLFNWVSCAYS
jgi:hypothetical protein